MAMGAAAVSAFLWLLSVPTAPECQRLSSLSPDIDRLYCSQIAASSGDAEDLLAGLALMSSWKETHPLYNEAQNWMAEWSASILEIADRTVRQGNLEQGRQLAQQIPARSPNHEDALAALAEWDETWAWGEDLVSQAQAAIRASQWGEVTQVIQTLRYSEYRYWRSQQTQALSEQVSSEKAAQRRRSDAQRAAQAGTPEGLSQAIGLAQQIETNTYTWAQMQPELNQWGDRLLDKGLKDWYATRFPEAIAVGELVAGVPDLAIDAHDLMILSRARKRAIASFTNWEPTIAHLWDLNRAIATAKAITPESRFYPQASSSIASWEEQIQDLSQLYQARLAADGGAVASYQTAISSAAEIDAGHLRRLQSQTLAAHWQREIERIEDQPYLRAAQQLAQSGGVADLRAAVVRAGQIQSDRALYGEAQGAIAKWTEQIQTIEDRPILDQARQHASRGQLGRAIREASAVRAGRALYGEARTLRRQWQAQIDAARQRSARQRPNLSPNAPAATPAPAAVRSAPARKPEVRQSAGQPAALPRIETVPGDRPAQSSTAPTVEFRGPVVAPLPDPQLPPDAVYPSETPAALTPAAPRFSNEFVDESGSVAEPLDVAPRSPATPSAPGDQTSAAPGSPAAPDPAAPADSRRSALPEAASEVGEAPLGPQSRLSDTAPPERIDLLPESSSLASAEFLGDESAFPLLYAGPLFVI